MSSLPNNYTHAAPNQCNQPNKETDKPCSKNKIRLTTTGRRCIWNTSEVVVLSAQIWARILVKIHTVSISRQSLITTVIRGHHKFLSIQEVIFVLCCLKGELYFFAREMSMEQQSIVPPTSPVLHVSPLKLGRLLILGFVILCMLATLATLATVANQ